MTMSRLDIGTRRSSARRLLRAEPESTCVAGESLAPGDHMVSSRRDFIAVMRTDGVVAVYHLDSGAELWSVGTRSGAGASLRMQDDGDLVVTSRDGHQLWSSETGGHPGAYVHLADDGRLTICSFYGDVLWVSHDPTLTAALDQ